MKYICTKYIRYMKYVSINNNTNNNIYFKYYVSLLLNDM